jgi:hypothetical protein
MQLAILTFHVTKCVEMMKLEMYETIDFVYFEQKSSLILPGVSANSVMNVRTSRNDFL